MNTRATLILFLLLIGVFISLAAYSLLHLSIRLDESQSIWVATKSIPQLLKLTAQDVHVPLYLLLLHFWIQIFGTNVFYTRVLSILFFVLTIPFLYKLAMEVSNKKTAFLTVTLFALSPFIVWYSSETRMYTMFVFVSAINSLYLVNFLKTRNGSGKLGLFITSVIGIYTHYFFVFQLATQFIYILGVEAYHFLEARASVSLSNIKQYFSLSLRFITTEFGVGLLFIPWLLFAIKSGFASYTQPLVPPVTSYNIFQTFILFIFGFQPQGIQSVIISLWPLAVLVIFLLFTNKMEFKPRFLTYFLLMVFLPIALAFTISFVKPLFLSRYLIFIIPNLLFVLSWIILGLSKRFSNISSTLIIAMLLLLLMYQNTLAYTPVKEDYQSAVNYLDQKTTPSDVVAVSVPFTVYPIEYYYQGNAKIVTIPDWDRLNQGAIPPFSVNNLNNQTQTFKKEYIRVFLVLSYDQGYEGAIKDYFEKNFERVDMQTLSSGLEIRVYRLRYDVNLPNQ